jgi:tetratricopeptide (TPR) repeat protein
MRKGQEAVTAGDPATAIGLAAAATRDGDRIAGPVLAAALVQEAHGHALDGQEFVCQEKLDEAQHVLTAPHLEPPPYDLAEHVNEPYIEAQRGVCWLRLGRPDRAVDSLDRALEGWPEDYRRELGLYLSRKAVALTSARQPEEAVAVARDALAIAHSTGSARIVSELRRLIRSLRSWEGDVLAVDAFIQEVSPLT